MKRQPFDPQVFLSTSRLNKTPKRYSPNQKVFLQGDMCDAIFYIQKGSVEVRVVSKQGKEAILGILRPGDFLGESCLSGQTKHLVSAVALVPCTILKIKKSEMVRALNKYTAFSGLFISYLLSRTAHIQANLVDQLFNSSEKRLARTLLILSSYSNEPKSSRVIPRVSQETLAKMVGVTRERVNFLMNKFRNLGFIDYNGGLEVRDSLLGIVLHE